MARVQLLGALFSVAFIAVTSGCRDSESQTGDDQTNTEQANENADLYTLTVQTYDKQEGSYDKGQIIKQPDEAEIKKQFQALNWADPNVRPSVKLLRMSQGKIQSLFVLRRNQESAEGEIEAQWLGLENGTPVTRTFSPIETPDAALNLILLYHSENPELKQAVSWMVEQ